MEQPRSEAIEEAKNYTGQFIDSIEYLTPEECAALGYVCAHDFKAFIAACLFDYFGYPFSPCHDFIADLINNQLGSNLRYVVAAPRGLGKSSLLTEASTAWLCLRKEYVQFRNLKDPRNKNYILIISDTIDQAVERLSTIKSHLDSNEIVAKLFPRSAGEGYIWKSDYIITKSGVAVRALGTGSKIRGRRYGTSRPDLLLGDDLENLEQVNSESMRAYLREWFTRDLLKAIDKERADIIVVGTVISKKALLYALLNDPEFAGWDGVVFKAITKWPKRMDLWDRFGEIIRDRQNPNHRQDAIEFYLAHKEEMDEGAEVLWPERWPLLDLMMEYYLEGKRSFMLERQNEVLEETERVFNVDDYYLYSEEELEEIPQARLHYYMYVDPATGKKKGSTRKKSTDMFACVVIAKDIKNNIYYVVDYFADIVPTSKQFTIIKHFIKTYPIFRFFVESNTSQFYYYQNLRDWLQRQGIHRPIPRQDINKVSKEVRIESLVPHLENWTLRIRQDHTQLLRDLSEYPAVEYDDLLDCLSSCFFKAYRTFKITYV